MPRPKKERLVEVPPLYTSFKPTGRPRKSLQRIELALDQYEALRLADYEGLGHEEAAEQMAISRSTFTRLLETARAAMASFLIEGKELCVNGGSVHFAGNILECENCGHMFKTGFADSFTTCPNCGSSNLIDSAGSFGHGKCCDEYTRKVRENS
ncbi:MAG: DUF134 domain-containing protein [Spirochaetales bacterium]|nr:DUF134 domain-containing protein [Spirochaetales bacterium]